MLADRILRHHLARPPAEDAIARAAMAPLPRLGDLIRDASRLAASSSFIAAAEALGHLRYEPLLRRLRGARLASDIIWLEFAAEEKEAVRTRLYSDRGMPLAPRAPGAAVPVAMGYMIQAVPRTRTFTVALVAEVVDADFRVGLSLCPYELVVDASPSAMDGAVDVVQGGGDIPDGRPSVAASRLDDRPDEAACLAELDARMTIRPLSWAPATIEDLVRAAPGIPLEDWWRDLASEAASIVAAIGILGHPSGLVFSAIAATADDEPEAVSSLGFQCVSLPDAAP